MKIIGLIGGTGPESTIDYYKLIIDEYRKKTNDTEYPHMIINSINLVKIMQFFRENRLEELTIFLKEEFERVIAAGADFISLTANTPHIVFDKLKELLPLPMISIVDETFSAVSRSGLKRVALFGTSYTMKNNFYHKVFEKGKIELISPDNKDMEIVHNIYVSELIKGVFLDSSRDKLKEVVERMKIKVAVEGLILGGTELPLILKEEDFPDFTLFNTTAIHVNKIVEEALK